MNKSFNNIVVRWSDEYLKTQLDNVTEERINRILSSETITSEDFLALLSPLTDNRLEEMAITANRLTVREFGKTMQIYAPLYLSNYCTNRCTYCGFNCNNNISRSKLSLEEVHIECRAISSTGIKHIILLTGGDRVNTPFSYIKSSVEAASEYFDSISIEMYSMSEKEYEELNRVGVQNVTIYQETYNREKYREVHIAGEKSHYDFRLDAPERAAKAGIRSVNLGALLGLDNPLKDFFLAALHTEYIFRKYPGCNVSISLPRIRNAEGSYKSEYEISDRDFVKFLMAFRIFMPKAGITMSTRESSEFRNSLIPLGITKMSAGSKTNVGGYTLNKSSDQFEISDSRSVDEIDEKLKSNGYQPVYKDWVLI